MKTKSLAMLAVAGFLTASFAYAAPVMGDDMGGNEMPMEQTMADNGDGSSAQASGGDAGTQNQAANVGQSDTSSNNNSGSGTNNSQSSNGGNDEGSPDTATGDDDY